MDIKSVIIKRRRQVIVCVVFLTAAGVIFFTRPHIIHDQEAVSPERSPVYRTVVDYNPDTFFAGVSKAKSAGDSSFGLIRAGVVPHHLLPGEILSDFFGRLSKQNIKTVYIVGPNHYNAGEKIVTAVNGWRTAFGDTDVDADKSAALREKFGMSLDDAVMNKEHSINGLIPYVKYYLPEAKVVPIILRRDVSEGEAKELAAVLNDLIGSDDALVASVDFSHYLDAATAVEKNSETLGVMNARNYSQLFQMKDDNLDSPPTLAVLLAWTELRGLGQGTVLFNTNSGILTNNKYMETTSYLSVVY